MKDDVNVLWLKRDLRLQDNKALNKAIESKLKIVAIYVFEPSQEFNYDFSYRHWAFIKQSLDYLSEYININFFYCEVFEVLDVITEKFNVINLFSHQETGNDTSYKRDLDIKSYLKSKNIPWSEYQTNAVVRGLKDKNRWDKLWIDKMNSPIEPSYEIKKENFISFSHEFAPPQSLNEHFNQKLDIAPNERNAQLVLESFIHEKVEDYFKNISLPEKSRYHSSRLSAYISWGNISIRQIYHYCKNNRDNVKNKKSLDQFMARLKWHCHFVQKLEIEPELEYKNINAAYDNIRTKKNKDYIKAWKNGSTGYPLIDAAMRCVKETGYLNFRLRATVVSFLTHHLWQDWSKGSGYLAKMFIDYEPGIHFSQFQMQAGTVGVHTIRIYNPVKQSLEKDKEAVFITKWVPELEKLPVELRHNPWAITEMESELYNFKLGRDYPKPIVDHLKAAQEANKTLHDLKNSKSSKKNALRALNKHVKRNKSFRR